MFPLNRLYAFYASDITPPIPHHTSPSLVNDVRSIEPIDFQCVGGTIIDYFNDIYVYSYT